MSVCALLMSDTDCNVSLRQSLSHPSVATNSLFADMHFSVEKFCYQYLVYLERRVLVRVWLLWLLILSCCKIFLPCDWPIKSCQEVALVVPDD